MRLFTLIFSLLFFTNSTAWAATAAELRWHNAGQIVAQYAQGQGLKTKFVLLGNPTADDAVAQVQLADNTCTFIINAAGNNLEAALFDRMDVEPTPANLQTLKTAIWAHELGHCLLWRHIGSFTSASSVQEEAFADVFALAFVYQLMRPSYDLVLGAFLSYRQTGQGVNKTRQWLKTANARIPALERSPYDIAGMVAGL